MSEKEQEQLQKMTPGLLRMCAEAIENKEIIVVSFDEEKKCKKGNIKLIMEYKDIHN